MSLDVSFIMLTHEQPITWQDLERGLQDVWPDCPEVSDGMEEENTVSLRVGDYDVAIGRMSAPLPWQELEGPCSTSHLWKDATAAVKQHTAHWIVTVSGEEEDPIENATMLMRATAAVMQVCETAIGVMWYNSRMVIQKPLFIDFTKKVLPGEIPLHLWIDRRIGLNEDGTSQGFTCGLAALGLMELEVESAPIPPRDLAELFFELAQYLLDNGLVINDRDTIGGKNGETIRILHTDSVYGTEGEVMRLVFE